MSTIFSKIISGDIPSYKIAEDNDYFAFLDINPLAKGHALVIPKNEIDNIFDMDSDEYQGLWLFAKRVAKALKAVIPCMKIGVAVIGLEVAHAHIHLVPINGIFDIDFSKEKLKLTNEEFEEILNQIRSEFE